MKKSLTFFCLLLLVTFFCLSASAESSGESWLCLACGNETSGESCPACGALRGQWFCDACRIPNLSDACLQCGKPRDQVLTEQADGYGFTRKTDLGELNLPEDRFIRYTEEEGVWRTDRPPSKKE